MLTLSGNNTYTGGTTISAGTIQVGNYGTSGSLGTGPVTNNGILAFARSDSLAVPGAIGGTGSVIQQGTGGMVTLASPNTYTGATTITSGGLSLSGLQATSGVAVSAGATIGVGASGATVKNLTLDSSSTITNTPGSDISAITVTNALVANGTTIAPTGLGLTLGQHVVVDYSGSIGGSGFAGFAAPVLPIRYSGNLVNNTANTSVDLKITAVKFPRWSGAINSEWDTGSLNPDGTPATGTQNWKEYTTTNATVYQEGPPADMVYFDDTATGSTNVNLNVIVQPSLVTVDNTTKDYSISGPGSISGSTSLIKKGGGTLTLSTSGVNTYTGGTTISGGTLAFNATMLPTTGSITMDGGTLRGTASTLTMFPTGWLLLSAKRPPSMSITTP